MPSPDCVARTVQVPVAIRVKVVADTVHVAVVCDKKLVVRPELALALNVRGAIPSA